MKRSAILVAGLMAGLGASALASGNNVVYGNEPRPELPMFRSNARPGKGKGKRPHRSVGTRAYQRAALKRRNQQRHRKACKGR